MKYKVTEKHPYLKKGSIIENTVLETENLSNLLFSSSEVNELLKRNYIEESQELEFTKIDMINFADYYTEKVRAGLKSGITFYANNSFDEWINKYKNEK